MFLSSLGIRRTNFISGYNFPAQWRPSFGTQRNLNFEVMAVRDNTKFAFVEKYVFIS